LKVKIFIFSENVTLMLLPTGTQVAPSAGEVETTSGGSVSGATGAGGSSFEHPARTAAITSGSNSPFVLFLIMLTYTIGNSAGSFYYKLHNLALS